ncbi:aminopeptidase N-like isoform X1 [Penaeus chinensis]|uniref:aminopeptidase N-like isoform X1 n=1 Tax=Penaeus chinensis TaxID=139456 RepID=UPI001FB7F7CF|nr:aminopeptidase N-like isoform X1 [Penaeus chinensis]XP_047482308.1 aminopeptidase N-like isoform X1 [Penaeus chinensis]XP_047482309.1 aminopeptidase N-like isoform X1 [Penaeus chinensis]XP_047482310.1 aminopeptidase N-like isoform X1 [Penaeus chinensis]
MTGSSRETLAMEMNQSAASVSFGKRDGCYVNRSVAVILGLLFVSATVATGLLVYYYAPQVREDGDPLNLARTSLATERPMIPTTPMSPVKEERIDVRLPRSVKPLHYKVKLQPLINGNFSILGYVEVEVEVLEATSNLTLHIADIVTKNKTIRLAPSDQVQGPGVGITKHSYDNERQFYIAELGEDLVVGQKYVLSMEFEGYLNDQLHGFYRSTYKAEDGSDRLIASTQFQPTDARRAFPCFDEPGMKATFEVYLGREEGMSSISNMPKFESIPIEGQPGWVWDHFNTSVPMSTYLVAFVISDFSHMNSTANDHVLFRVWARKAAIEQADYALTTGPDILTFFEGYFDVPFPLPKQDMIAIPDFSAGAMENWGLITYRETAMLYDPAVSAASNKQRVVVVVAHELAHQWFGNLVTPEWWTDLWLNEGFASFMEFLGVNHSEPSWKMMEQFVTEDLQDVFAIDCLESSHPISIPVGHPDEINEIFDRISYAKGASIIRMMNHFLTEATFRKGLSNYLTDLKYQNAEQDDLWQYLTTAAHDDNTLPADVSVKKIMDTWTLQMGYPVIKVTRSSDGTSATVSQERFLLVKNPNSTDTHDYKWWVPLSYTTETNPDFETTKPQRWMMDTEEQLTISSLPAKDKWVIFNVQETGYYRVNYDAENWNLIIQQLKDNHEALHVINRAQIIDDVLNLARGGQVSYDTALSVNVYLGKEVEFVPWDSALNNLAYLENMFTRSSGYGDLKSYLLDILIPLYNSVGFDDNLNDPHLDQFKRVKALAWACNLGYQDCVDKSQGLFNSWVQNPSNTSLISPNLKSTVYCTGVAEGGEDEWNFAWEQYINSNVATEKSKLLSAMGCTKEVWILSRYLDMAFTEGSGIRKQDASQVFAAVARNDVGRYLAWNFLRDQWQQIADYYGSGFFAIARIIKAATISFNTKLELAELELFKEDHAGQLGTATRAVDQAIERTENNIKWMDDNYEVIMKWLADNGYSSKLKGV